LGIQKPLNDHGRLNIGEFHPLTARNIRRVEGVVADSVGKLGPRQIHAAVACDGAETRNIALGRVEGDGVHTGLSAGGTGLDDHINVTVKCARRDYAGEAAAGRNFQGTTDPVPRREGPGGVDFVLNGLNVVRLTKIVRRIIRPSTDEQPTTKTKFRRRPVQLNDRLQIPVVQLHRRDPLRPVGVLRRDLERVRSFELG